MSDKKILVIGGGIAGALTAFFLKQNGFLPEVYERVSALGDVGGSLAFAPNGLKVLSQIPGLVEKFLANGASLDYLSHRLSDGTILNETFVGNYSSYFGYPLLGMKRTLVLNLLHEELNRQLIPVHFNKSLCGLIQSTDNVTAEFQDGANISGDYLIGCDGLRSTVRQLLFGSDHPTYTGLTQTIGISKRTDILACRSLMLNVYGDGGKHFITYPFDSEHVCFACTFRQTNADAESWRSLSNEQALQFVQECGFDQWASPVDKPISNTSRLIKIGFPSTSPHLGQGANQAIEDAYYLVKFWVKNINNHTQAFEDYTQIRKERTTRLVQAARRQGEARVCTQPEQCERRNSMLSKVFNIDDIKWLYHIEL